MCEERENEEKVAKKTGKKRERRREKSNQSPQPSSQDCSRHQTRRPLNAMLGEPYRSTAEAQKGMLHNRKGKKLSQP